MIDDITIDNSRIYALIRVSDDKQSLQSQMESINKYCRNNNIELLDENIIIEHGISAFKTEYEDRKGLNTILDLVAKDKINLLIVFNSDRISRRKHDVEDFIFKLTYANVKIISTTEGQLNLNNDTDSLITSIKGWVNEYESSKIAVRVKNGLLAKQKEKQSYFHGGKILLGYKVVNKKLMVDDTTAPIIRRVYKLYIDYGTSKAIEYLASMGINRNAYSLLRMLKNTTYKGYSQHHKKNYSEADYKDITYYNKDLAIVSESTWNTANNLIQKRRRVKNSSVGYDFRTSFMFEGLCYCECGGKLHIEYDYRPTTPRRYLQCRRCKTNKVTTQKNYSLLKLEPQIEKAIAEVLKYELDRDKLEEHYNLKKNNNVNQLKELYQLKKKELASKEKAVNNSNNKLELLLSSDTDINTIKIIADMINRFNAEADELKKDIEELEEQIQEQQQINQEQNEKIELFSKLGQVYKLASADKQKQILNILIDKIVVSNDYSYNIKVYLNY